MEKAVLKSNLIKLVPISKDVALSLYCRKLRTNSLRLCIVGALSLGEKKTNDKTKDVISIILKRDWRL